MGLGKVELILIIVLVIIVLFYGSKKLPELARSVGQSAKELKKGFRDDLDDDKKEQSSDKTDSKKS
jgi:sec-independent protein translocase protein TatA